MYRGSPSFYNYHGTISSYIHVSGLAQLGSLFAFFVLNAKLCSKSNKEIVVLGNIYSHKLKGYIINGTLPIYF